MSTEPQLAFYQRLPEPPGLEIRVNFGIFAGRPATAAEIDELAQSLLTKVGEISIVAEDRHEIGPHSEAEVYQVRIEVGDDELPSDAHELDELSGRLIEAADRWTRECIAERPLELSET